MNTIHTTNHDNPYLQANHYPESRAKRDALQSALPILFEAKATTTTANAFIDSLTKLV